MALSLRRTGRHPADSTARTAVFVEVKTRTSEVFGVVEQAVTPDKIGGCAAWPDCGSPVRTAAGPRSASTSSECASDDSAIRRSPTCGRSADGAG